MRMSMIEIGNTKGYFTGKCLMRDDGCKYKKFVEQKGDNN